MAANDCHMYIVGLNPTRYTAPQGSTCWQQARVISTTHETEGLGGGDMFALLPPSDGNFDANVPWNVTFRPYALDLGLDNRAAKFPTMLSNNGRPIDTGYLGTFLDVKYQRAASLDTAVQVSFDDLGTQLEGASAARVVMGFHFRSREGIMHTVEVNLRIAGSWDVCTSADGPRSQLTGTPLGLGPAESCDPTSARAIDYRSYNRDARELVYFSGHALLSPTVSGSRPSYYIPITALFSAYPWKQPGTDNQLIGLYFGIEHHEGARTRVVLRQLTLVAAGPSTTQRAAIDRMQSELQPAAVTQPQPSTPIGGLELAQAQTTGYRLHGWACTPGINGPTLVHLRARPVGSAGIGTWIKTIKTSSSTSYSTSACQNNGNDVFDVTVPHSAISGVLGQQVVIVARNNATGAYQLLNTLSAL